MKPSWVCALFRHSNINLHWLDSPELVLENDTIVVGCDVILGQMTSFDPPSWIRYFGFSFFPKKSRNNGNLYKIKPKCLWTVQIGEFREFDEENWKKIQNYVKKVDFLAKPSWNLWLLWKHKKWWTQNWHIKISAKDEWTTNESFS